MTDDPSNANLIRTPRLILRRWRESDLAPFAEMNADPLVMEYFPALLARAESDALAARIEAGFDKNGFGLWALEIPEDSSAGVEEAPFIGHTGLSVPSFAAPFTPCVEVGWRLAHAHWGKGYASEAARAALRFGFESAGLAEIVSFTAVANARSRRVMEKIGMTRDPAEDFEHPSLPPGHPLSLHVLYRLGREAWVDQAREAR